MKSGIYKIINIINNNIYIGSTKNIRKRKNEHFARLKINKHSNVKLQRSYNKHGVNNFVFEVIELVDECCLIEKEQYYLDLLNPYYNICKIANSITGLIRTKEWTDKISMANRGRKASKETRKKQSLARMGRSPANKGIPRSQETKDKISKTKIEGYKTKDCWSKGRKFSKEHIENMSKSRIGKKHPESQNKKIALGNIGKHNKKVIQLSVDDEFIKEHDSITEALKVAKGVANVLRNRAKTSGGFKWIYKNK